jgi:hypothetical protein
MRNPHSIHLTVTLSFLLLIILVPFAFASQHPSFPQFASPMSQFTLSKSAVSFPTNASTDTITVSITDSAIYRSVNTSYNGQSWVQRTLSAGTPSSCTAHPDDAGGTWLTGTCTLIVPVAASDFSFSAPGTTKTRNYITAYSCTENVLDLGLVRFRLGWDCHGTTTTPNMWQIHNFTAGLASWTQQPATVTITASSYENDGININPPQNAYDGSLATRWSALGVGEWIQFGFSSPQTINRVHIAFYNGASGRVSYFNVSVSNDNQSWTQVYSGQGSGTSNNFETFSFNTVTAPYLRITGRGNSVSLWNSYTEVNWSYYAVLPTCSDGIQNQGEAGVDCGGPCAACPTCSDGQMNGNETGIDCGGIPCPVCECTGPQTISCTVTNGAGQETRPCTLGHYGSWGTCTAVSCNSGYHLSGAFACRIPALTASRTRARQE